MSNEPERLRDPKYVQSVLRQWSAAQTFLQHYPVDSPIRVSYERAFAALAPTLERFQSLPDLIADYFAPPKQTKQREKLLTQVCTDCAYGGRPLLSNMVEQGAYYQRAQQLLATWWTNDWPVPQSPQTAPDPLDPLDPPPPSQPPAAETRPQPSTPHPRRRRPTTKPTTPAAP